MVADYLLAIPNGGKRSSPREGARLKAEGVAALVDPEGWQRLITGAEKTYRELLAASVPAEVAIDEAVELAKRYASPEAAKLVNGALGAWLRASRAGQQTGEVET